MIHAGDILYVGTKQFWDGAFLKEMKTKFTVSHEQLEGPSSSIKFLRRKMVETEDWLVLMPWQGLQSKELSMRLRRHLAQHVCRRFRVMPAFNSQTAHQD